MALSGAEWQRRYRARKKAAANAAGLVERPREGAGSQGVDLQRVREVLFDIVVSKDIPRDMDRIAAARVLLQTPELEDPGAGEQRFVPMGYSFLAAIRSLDRTRSRRMRRVLTNLTMNGTVHSTIS